MAGGLLEYAATPEYEALMNADDRKLYELSTPDGLSTAEDDVAVVDIHYL